MRWDLHLKSWSGTAVYSKFSFFRLIWFPSLCTHPSCQTCSPNAEGVKVFLSVSYRSLISQLASFSCLFWIIYFRCLSKAIGLKSPCTLLPLEERSFKSVCVYCLYSKFMLLCAFFHMQIAVPSLFWVKVAYEESFSLESWINNENIPKVPHLLCSFGEKFQGRDHKCVAHIQPIYGLF